MTYNTNDVIELLNSEFKKNPKKALEIFERALPRDEKYDSYRRSIVLLQNQLNFYEGEYSLSIRNDRTDIHRVLNGFQDLLQNLKKESGKRVVLNKIKEFNTLIPVNNAKGYNKKDDVSILDNIKYFFSKNKKFIPIIAVIAAFLFLTPTIKRTFYPKETNQSSEISVVTTTKPKPVSRDYWAVYLTDYDNLKDAITIKKKYPNRNITIIKEDDKYFLYILRNSEQKAEEELSDHVKETWIQSRIIKLDACLLQKDRYDNCYICR